MIPSIAAMIPLLKKIVRFSVGCPWREAADPLSGADESVNAISTYYLVNEIKNEQIRRQNLPKKDHEIF